MHTKPKKKVELDNNNNNISSEIPQVRSMKVESVSLARGGRQTIPERLKNPLR